jgi:type IV pilus assembly protein PilW
MSATTERRRPGAGTPAPHRRQRGISIIELMVGIVVAMLVSLAAAGSAMVFTASQRQGIGAGGVSVGGGTALSAIKNDAALAGLGFFGDSAYLCSQLDLSKGAGVIVDGTTFVPVQITDEGNDDRVDIVYADRIESGANVLLRSASNGTSAELQSLLPDADQQAVLLAPATAGGTCLVRTVTAVTASTDTTPQILTFGATGTHNQAAFSVAPVFAERDRIALLGEVHWNRYRRIGNTLTLERPMDGSSAVLARNVVSLRMQYGLAAAAANSTTLESWVDATGAFSSLDAAELARVRAIRIQMVTRSPQRQKPDASGNCDATQALPKDFANVDIVPDVADWRCYRFKTSTVVVPLRNLVLGLKV